MKYDDKLIYDLWLTGIKGIGPAAQHELLDTFGFPEEVYHASEADLIDAGISESRRKLILEARDLDDAGQELEKCRKGGIFLLTNRDEIYPENLRNTPDMPVLLYGKGKPELFSPDADLGIDLEAKWQAFGWETISADGHDMDKILEAFAKAGDLKGKGKPVMIDFTGFGCVNCRKMEAAVWIDPMVSDILNNRYVLISLYVDDKTPLPSPIEITENGKSRTLRTVGDKWSYLQRVKFGANAQPFYVLLDNDGMPLYGSRSYDEDIPAYIDFLEQGIAGYKK